MLDIKAFLFHITVVLITASNMRWRIMIDS